LGASKSKGLLNRIAKKKRMLAEALYLTRQHYWKTVPTGEDNIKGIIIYYEYVLVTRPK
jgi:hypothetical protein